MLQDIIKSAMLGTNQYVPSALTPLTQEVKEKINTTSQDKEDAFLKLAAGFFLLENAGRQLPNLQVQHTAPDSETKQLISIEASALLKQFLLHKEEVFLDYFLFRCLAADKIAQPELLPEILSMAVEKKGRREALLRISGERGKWLAQLNPAWQKLYAPEEELIWETGTWEQRKVYLKNIRLQQPEQAIAHLHSNLKEEAANNRAELLDILQYNLSLADEPFLESQLQDKSQKVKQVVYSLLLQLRDSRLNKLVQNYVHTAVQIKEERVLLLAKKKVFVINEEVPLPEELFAAGFEKTSSQKNVDDAEYWLSQAMAYLHPDFWTSTYGLSLEETVSLWAKHTSKHLFLPALVQSGVRFKHTALARTLLNMKEVGGAALLSTLEIPERFQYVGKFSEEHPAMYLQMLIDETYMPIPAAINKELLQQFAKKPYTFSQPQYLRWAMQMQADTLPHLQYYAQTEYEDYQMRFFRNVCVEMSHAIQTKEHLNALL